MYNTNQLPPMFNDGSMDPKILKHFLLLHDNQDGPAEKYAYIFNYKFIYSMSALTPRKTLAKSIFIIQLHSSVGISVED